MKQNDKLFDWCLNMVIQHCENIEALDLSEGKAGIALSLFVSKHFFSEDSNPEKKNVLFNEVYENINFNNSLGFSEGLGGIAWSFEYAAQKGFINIDSDEFFEDIDYKYILSLKYKKPDSIDLNQGLLGYCFYFLRRLMNDKYSDEDFSLITSKHCLKLLLQELEFILEKLNYSIEKPQNETVFWDLPILFILMANCIENNIFSQKVNKIAEKLIEKIDQKSSSDFSTGLVLHLALKYFELKTKKSIKFNFALFQKLRIKDFHNKYSLNGLSGIALFYNQLFILNKDIRTEEYSKYYISMAEKKINEIKLECFQNNKYILNHLGLFNGISGFIFAKSLINKNEE